MIDANGVREHWVPSSGGHELYVQDLPPGTGASPDAAAVLCLHGIFSDSRFFYNRSRPHDTARWFAARGYRVFLGNLRGHGRSRWPDGKLRWDWNFDTYVNSDIPALIDFAANAHPGPLFLLGHSFGGYAAMAALGVQPALQARLRGACTLAAAVNDYSDGGLAKRIELPLASLLARCMGRMPARRLRLGPCDEPPALMAQIARWARHGSFRSLDGAKDYWQLVGRVTLPVYAGVGAADRFHASPARARKLLDHLGGRDRTFQVFGQRDGFARDFGHFDLATGRAAAEAVFPRVDAWMRARLA